MGRLEDRVRRLEEADDKIGFAAAVQRLGDEDTAVLGSYMRRWAAQGGERVVSPDPITPEEVAMLQKLHALRREAIAEGWSNSAYRAY